MMDHQTMLIGSVFESAAMPAAGSAPSSSASSRRARDARDTLDAIDAKRAESIPRGDDRSGFPGAMLGGVPRGLERERGNGGPAAPAASHTSAGRAVPVGEAVAPFGMCSRWAWARTCRAPARAFASGRWSGSTTSPRGASWVAGYRACSWASRRVRSASARPPRGAAGCCTPGGPADLEEARG